MPNADDIFNAAPRRTAMEPVGEIDVEVVEMTTFQRLEIADIMKKKPKARDFCYAEIVKRSCPVFKDKEAQEILDRLSPEALFRLANKAIELGSMATTEKKSPGPIQNVSSIA